MKRLVIGILVLVLLPLGGLLSTLALERAGENMERALRLADERYTEENRAGAEEAIAEAAACWEGVRPLAACLTDHDRLLEIDRGFGELEIARDCGDFLGQCRDLELLVHNLTASERLYYYNILSFSRKSGGD